MDSDSATGTVEDTLTSFETGTAAALDSTSAALSPPRYVNVDSTHAFSVAGFRGGTPLVAHARCGKIRRHNVDGTVFTHSRKRQFDVVETCHGVGFCPQPDPAVLVSVVGRVDDLHTV